MKPHSYKDVVGDPAELTREQLQINITAMERLSAPFYDWFHEADEGSEHEAYLLYRIGEMGNYLIECYQELAKREETKCDVITTPALRGE